jgi:hypothetical protein
VKYSVLQGLRQQLFGLDNPLHDADIDVAIDRTVHDAMLKACEPVQSFLQARQSNDVQGQLPQECVKELLYCGFAREPLEVVSLITCADIRVAVKMADAIKRSRVMSDFKLQFLAWAVVFAGRQAVGGRFLSHCLHSACNEKQYYASAGKMTKVRMNHPELLDLAKGIKYLCRWGGGLRVTAETFSILSGGEVLNTLAVMAMTASEMTNGSQLDVSGADGTTVSYAVQPNGDVVVSKTEPIASDNGDGDAGMAATTTMTHKSLQSGSATQTADVDGKKITSSGDGSKTLSGFAYLSENDPRFNRQVPFGLMAVRWCVPCSRRSRVGNDRHCGVESGQDEPTT